MVQDSNTWIIKIIKNPLLPSLHILYNAVRIHMHHRMVLMALIWLRTRFKVFSPLLSNSWILINPGIQWWIRFGQFHNFNPSLHHCTTIGSQANQLYKFAPDVFLGISESYLCSISFSHAVWNSISQWACAGCQCNSKIWEMSFLCQQHRSKSMFFLM